VYDVETRQTIAALDGLIDTEAATAAWDAALAAPWPGPPVWVHGDVAVGNLLVQTGRLSAVIDFGCSAVGDPACDLVIAWTLLSGASRAAFVAGVPVEAAAWARGRGWALWKALITLAGSLHTDPAKADEARRVIAAVLADHQQARGTV
jgi:aminoglycoside phosphotransferase (APT) family kinase protein